MANEKVTVGIIRRGSKKLEGESSFSLVSLTSRLPRLGEAKGREPKLKMEPLISDVMQGEQAHARSHPHPLVQIPTPIHSLTHSRITH